MCTRSCRVLHLRVPHLRPQSDTRQSGEGTPRFLERALRVDARATRALECRNRRCLSHVKPISNICSNRFIGKEGGSIMQNKSYFYRLVTGIGAVILLQILPAYANGQPFLTKILQQEVADLGAYSYSAGNLSVDPGRLNATGMTNGTPVTFTLPSVSANTLFRGDYSYTIVVPPGASRLIVQLAISTPNADVDLYVRFGQDVALSGTSVVADYRSEHTTGDETITINTPQAGTYYIAFGVFTLNVSISCTVTATYQLLATSGMVVAQYVNGSGWTTALFLTNLSSISESYTVRFFGPGGSPRRAPIQGLGSVETIVAALSPGQTAVYETSPTASLEPGWAIVTPSAQNSKITGFAVFRYHTSGAPDSEAIVTPGNTTDKSLVMLYDQRSNFATGLALVNPNPTPIALTVMIREQSGNIIGSDIINLPAYGQQSSFIYERYPITLNKVGSLSITSDSGFSAIGLRFSPYGTFTSFPPLVQDEAPSGCGYSISPTSRSHGAGSETGIVNVTASSGCGWTAKSNDTWIGITTGSSGTGNGSVTYSVVANTGQSSRTGTITIAGQNYSQNFQVNQAAQSTPTSKQMAEKILGNWTFTYTIGSTFSQKYSLTYLWESTSTPGAWYAAGTDEYGDPVLAGWADTLSLYLLLDKGSVIDRTFTFDFTGPNSVAGCYYQMPSGTTDLSQCYPMTGIRTSSLGPALTSSAENRFDMELRALSEDRWLSMNQGAPDPRLVEALESMRRVIR